jgi:hypothetical protein
LCQILQKLATYTFTEWIAKRMSLLWVNKNSFRIIDRMHGALTLARGTPGRRRCCLHRKQWKREMELSVSN